MSAASRPGRLDVRTAIVEAAATLLATEGSHAVTTRAVAEAAGVQAPTIYRLFGDKDGLLDAVAEHVMAAYVSEKAVVADHADVDPVDGLRSAWQTHIDFGLANPDLFVMLSQPGRVTSSPAASAGIDVLRTRVRRIAEAGRLRVDEERAVHMIHAAGTGAVLTLLGQSAAERDDGFSDAMFDLVAAGILSTGRAATKLSKASRSVTPSARASTLAVTFMTVLDDLPALTDAERGLMAEWLSRSVAELQRPG